MTVASCMSACIIVKVPARTEPDGKEADPLQLDMDPKLLVSSKSKPSSTSSLPDARSAEAEGIFASCFMCVPANARHRMQQDSSVLNEVCVCASVCASVCVCVCVCVCVWPLPLDGKIIAAALGVS
jgi:hypothetical protein